jgi:hypothetical protein
MSNAELCGWAITLVVAFGLGWLVGFGAAIVRQGGRDE